MGTLAGVKLASTEWVGAILHTLDPLLLQGSRAACLALGEGRMLPPLARTRRQMLRSGIKR